MKHNENHKLSAPVIDSHAHLDMEAFDQDRESVIKRALGAGIEAILCPAEVTSSRSLETTLKLQESHAALFAAAGVHPHQARNFSQECLQIIKELCEKHKILAVGEIGLDFHYNYSPPAVQKEAFRCQLSLAQELSLPVIVHSRLAGKEIVEAAKEEKFSQGGVLHCFTDDLETAKQMIDRNFFISFTGIITFPNAHQLREVAEKIPSDRLLLETDSPYLAPVPYRGKRNEPAYVVEVARTLASLKKLPLPELAELTTRNFTTLFLNQ
ncbi:MAG: TatD family hydrolase [Candidatus Aminicenantales bacterium]